MKSQLFLFFVIISYAVQSQNLADTIMLSTNLKGFQFIHQGNEIQAKEVFLLMEHDDLAYDEFNASREAYFFGNIFGIIGSGLIIYPFASSALGLEPNYGPAFAGICFIGISIPIFRSYNKKTISAIYLYNQGLSKPLEPELQGSLSLGATKSGISLLYTF
ncbi:MAG: hypothetical protein PF517_08110 [Salinivirgaceae bacterium]|nr:hypothetical protein [Salinivirgaceae bacterium]